jgi:hypothetical protein
MEARGLPAREPGYPGPPPRTGLLRLLCLHRDAGAAALRAGRVKERHVDPIVGRVEYHRVERRYKDAESRRAVPAGQV